CSFLGVVVVGRLVRTNFTLPWSFLNTEYAFLLNRIMFARWRFYVPSIPGPLVQSFFFWPGDSFIDRRRPEEFGCAIDAESNRADPARVIQAYRTSDQCRRNTFVHISSHRGSLRAHYCRPARC